MNRKEFERVSPESVGIPSEAILSIINELERASYCEPHGLIMMRWGKIFAEGWWAPYASNIPHSLYSVTKTFTATALGIAYTDGLISLDDYISSYFTEYKGKFANDFTNKIKVKDVLTMTSGKPEIRCSTFNWIRHYFEMPAKYTPGTKWVYNCEDTHNIMALVQKVTGRFMDDYLRDKLFTKIGINPENIYWARLPDNSPIGCGGLFATTEDVLRLMNLYLNKGLWEGEQILSKDFVKLATRTQVNIGFDSAIADYADAGCEPGYGYQIWTNLSGISDTYASYGILGQFGVVLPKLNIIISFNSFAEEPNTLKAILNIIKILKESAQPTSLSENSEANNRLKNRLRSLSLAAPEVYPYGGSTDKLSGKKFTAIKDRFIIKGDLWKSIADFDLSFSFDGIDSFCFIFDSTDMCKLRIYEQGTEYNLDVGLDGLRRLNIYPMNKLDRINKVLLDGSWKQNNVFLLNARWIQTCYSISILFVFEDGIASVTAQKIIGDFRKHPMRFKTYKYKIDECNISV